MSKTISTWTEYRNGFGSYLGGSNMEKATTYFMVPSGFSAAIKRSGGIDVSSKNFKTMADMVRGLGCQSDLRRRLEANMVAYFNGQQPAFRKSSK